MLGGGGWLSVGPLTAGDGVRQVARTVLLRANVADTARIKREHRRLGEGRKGKGGRAAESLSLSQKKGRRKLGLVREEENFGFLIPLPFLWWTKRRRFRKVDVSFSRSPKTLIFLIIRCDSIRKGFRPCGNPQSPIENERERSKGRPRFGPDPRTIRPLPFVQRSLIHYRFQAELQSRVRPHSHQGYGQLCLST